MKTPKEIIRRKGRWDMLFRRFFVPTGDLLVAGEILLLVLFIGLYCLGKW